MTRRSRGKSEHSSPSDGGRHVMSVTPGAAAATTGLLGSRSGALEWETTRVSSLTLSGEDRFLELFQKTWFHEDVPTSHHDLLRQAGLRVTAPRLAVLAEVEAAPHSDADTVRNGVSDRLGEVSTQAVYDSCARSPTPGCSAHRARGRHRAATRSPGGDNHHHLVCRACGDVVDVACATGDAPCLDATSTHGFARRRRRGHLLGLLPRLSPNPPDEGRRRCDETQAMTSDADNARLHTRSRRSRRATATR